MIASSSEKEGCVFPLLMWIFVLMGYSIALFEGSMRDGGSMIAFTEWLGLAAGTCTTLAFIPQVVEVWRTRHVRDISFGMYIIFSTAVSLWLIYGVVTGSMSMILANSCTLTLGLAILSMKIAWGSKSKASKK